MEIHSLHGFQKQKIETLAESLNFEKQPLLGNDGKCGKRSVDKGRGKGK